MIIILILLMIVYDRVRICVKATEARLYPGNGYFCADKWKREPLWSYPQIRTFVHILIHTTVRHMMLTLPRIWWFWNCRAIPSQFELTSGAKTPCRCFCISSSVPRMWGRFRIWLSKTRDVGKGNSVFPNINALSLSVEGGGCSWLRLSSFGSLEVSHIH